MPGQHAALTKRYRKEGEAYQPAIRLRIHRALSWLGRAEQCEPGHGKQGDKDAHFLFLWIAFNAAYANDLTHIARTSDDRPSETHIFANFIGRLVELDTGQALYDLVWSEFPKSIRLILDNRYIFPAFWDFQNGRISEEDWRKKLRNQTRAANNALAKRNTKKLLLILLTRLYTLRNQLVHGGSTWNSSVNREQLRDSVALLGKLVPLIIKTLMDHPDEVWGDPAYPLVDTRP